MIFGFVSGARGFIAKFDSRMSQWITTFGGGPNTWARDVIVDENQNVYVVGITATSTYSSNTCVVPNSPNTEFPDCSGNNLFHQSSYGGSASGDGFIMSFDQDGILIWSTYIGGNDPDVAQGITYDPTFDRIYVCGFSRSYSGFPVANPQTGNFQQSSNASISNYDATLCRFDVSGIVSVPEESFQPHTLNIHPNPTSNILLFDIGNARDSEVDITITNVLGQTILIEHRSIVAESRNNEILLPYLAEGLYTIVIESEGIVYVNKFVVQW